VALGCQYVNNVAPCDDGDACTTDDTCADGTCVGGPPLDCDDGNLCTDDTCDTEQGCQYANNAAACDDGDACTTIDICSNGRCTGGDPLDCDDGLYCTGAETCDASSGCQPGTPPCTTGQWCYEDIQACIGYGGGDFEPDGDVDLVDFMNFQMCFGALGIDDCRPANMSGAGQVDLDDFALFADELDVSGPQ
jgi:hypothetical protein